MTDLSAAVDPGLESLVAQVADEFRERQKQGEQPDIEEYAARYPEAALLLRKVLASLHLVGLSMARGTAPANAESGAGLPPALGDFHLVREVGRGGMGVVYEAVQVSLKRRVALKVLPFAAVMDPRQLQRFQNEAQAAASLHHTNIVPVYAIGCACGVHFYAMQYIEGQPLSAVVTELQQAALSGASSRSGQEFFRFVAQLGIQAAEALDHAHQLGIIHRDIKPANLLVEVTGRLWVTDFGLAQVQGDARLTLTGDLLGTLRYMSPEQALARRGVVDHRTDIYALGTTLYELLASEPAYGGKDRQELLRQIAFEEPRPLRRRNKIIPADLETIVLKAMEKDPAQRYATAGELADDLRRFLSDEPIRARRPSLAQRARKWVRRHQTTVRVVTAVLLTILVSRGVAWRREQLQGAAVERAVEANLQQAEVLQQQERWEEVLAVLQLAEGQLGNWRMEGLREQLKRRKRDVEMLKRLEEARLQVSFGSKEMPFDFAGADRLYAEAFAWYGLDVMASNPEEAAERVRESAICTGLCAALDHWALLRNTMNRGGGKPLWAVAQLAGGDPWHRQIREAAWRKDWAALEELAEPEQVLRRTPGDLLLLASALRTADGRAAETRLLQRAQQVHPDDFWINFQLATVLQEASEDLGEVVRFWQAALALRPLSPVVWNNLGSALEKQGKLVQAVAAYQKAISLNPDYAVAHINLANAARKQGKLEQAVAAYQQAIAAYQQAIAAYQQAIDLKPAIALVYYNLGIALDQQGKLAQTVAAYQKAIDLKLDTAEVHFSLGTALTKQGKLAAAVAAYRKAIDRKPDFADAYYNLGIALAEQGRLPEAEAAYQKTIRLQPDNAPAHNNLASVFRGQGKPAEAEAASRKALQLMPESALVYNNLGSSLHDQGKLAEAEVVFRKAVQLEPNNALMHNNLGAALLDQGKLAEAEAAFCKAIQFRPEDGLAHYRLGGALLHQGKLAEALAEFKRSHELSPQTPGWPYPAAQWVRQTAHLIELDTKLSKVLRGEARPVNAGERAELAFLCFQFKGLYHTAVRLFREAFAAEPSLGDNLPRRSRYHAACAAALAGGRQGKDTAALDDQECARLRRQALEWLRSDLEALRHLSAKKPNTIRLVVQQLQQWQKDRHLAGVRDPKALALLPETDRKEWQKLWTEVGQTLVRAQEKDLEQRANKK
jgi:tetratricopeptide (TPR) repeat protein